MDRELLLELKSFLAERMVDNMTTEDLAEYVQDDLFNISTNKVSMTS